MKIQTLANQILKTSLDVQQITICDLNGKLVYTAHSKSVKNVLSARESRESLRKAAIAWKQRKSLSRKLGRCKSVVAEYDRIKRITVPIGRKYLLFVSTTPETNHSELINRIHHFRTIPQKVVDTKLITKTLQTDKTSEDIQPLTIHQMAKMAISDYGKFKINHDFKEKFIQMLTGAAK